MQKPRKCLFTKNIVHYKNKQIFHNPKYLFIKKDYHQLLRKYPKLYEKMLLVTQVSAVKFVSSKDKFKF